MFWRGGKWIGEANAQHRSGKASDPHSPQPELKGTSLFTEQELKDMYRQVMGLVFNQEGAVMKYSFVDKLATSCGLVLVIKCSYF